MQVQRLNPEAITGQYQAFGGLAPEPQGEHPAKTRETVHIPLEKGLEGYFRIATSSKTMTQRFQFSPKLGVVVDLAVKDGDGVAVFAAQGLVAASQIDDLEA